MLRVRDTWVRLLLILVPFVIMAYINGLTDGITITKLGRTAVSFAAIILVCEGSRYLVYNSRKWFSPKYRMLLIIVTGLAWTTLVLAASSVLKKYIATGTWDASMAINTNIVLNDKRLITGLFGYAFLNAVINFSLLLIIFEALYRSALLNYTEKEKEKLVKEKLEAELLQLKGIVNPHFLFNNLNSLSSLIAEDPEKAQVFLDELTSVFRYLLRNNQSELTFLSEELKFIRTYYQLLRTRYGQGISMDIRVEEGSHDLLIPPLTLQLLVENAVKHNKVHKEAPLHIDLLSLPGKKLLVRNTISRREGRVESTGIGLQNINARYKIFNHEGVVIEKDEKNFGVIIPLLETDNK